MIRTAWILAVALFIVAAAGCKRDDMADQPRYKPLSASTFYVDGASARTPVDHTVARNAPLEEDSVAWRTPVIAVDHFPFEITRDDIVRGGQLYQVNCIACHGALGDGDGMVPERGFTRPPTFHTDRLRAAPPSYFYNVITNGIGAMYPLNDHIAPDDRWRVATYIRALQLSQNAPLDQLPPASASGGQTP